METGNLLSQKLKEIDELELSASIQKKKGWFYVVINFKQDNGTFKPIWRSTKIQAIPGNKKKANNKKAEIIQQFKEELKDKVKKEFSNNQITSVCTPEPHTQMEITNKDVITTNDGISISDQRQQIYINMSFTDFCLESLSEFKPNVAQTTYECWYNNFKYRICNFFKAIPLEERENMVNPNVKRAIYYNSTPKLIDISQYDIEDFIKWLHDCKLKGSSIDKYYEFLKLVIDRAIRRKIISKANNPIADVKRPHIEKYIPDYYKPSELKQLISGCKNDILFIPILFAAYYGLRRSEVIGIKWSAINFEENMFTIRHTVTRVTGNGENQVIYSRDLAKSESGYRSYPLLKEVKDALNRHKMSIEMKKRFLYKNSYVRQTEQYVCVNEIGELIKPDYFSINFKKLTKKLNLKKIRLHDVRHSVGSLLITNGSNLEEVKDFLGHGSIRSTEIYSHLEFSSKVESLNRVTKAIEKVRA